MKVKPVYRSIVKKNELQGPKRRPFDVLVCGHAVPVDAATRANTYRRSRQCPPCRQKVQEYVASQQFLNS